MNEEQQNGVALLERWYGAWDAHDADALATMVTDDVAYLDPGAPGGAVHGRAAVVDAARALFIAVPDWTVVLDDVVASPDGSVVVVRWRASGHAMGSYDPPGFAPTNQPIAIEGMARAQLSDGLVASLHIFYDLVGVGRQLGAFPPEGSAGDRLGLRLQHFNAWRMRRRARAA